MVLTSCLFCDISYSLYGSENRNSELQSIVGNITKKWYARYNYVKIIIALRFGRALPHNYVKYNGNR